MGTLIVTVNAECEELITSLPRGEGWELQSEDYNEDGSGVIVIGFDDDELSAAAEQALNTHDGVISWRVQ